MTLTDAIRWAETADPGDYLITYDETGLPAAEDPGSRCGFDDAALAEIESMLRARDLTLMADDRRSGGGGLVVTVLAGPPVPRAPVCAWCPGFDPRDPAQAGRSHGLCPVCQARLLAELDAHGGER